MVVSMVVAAAMSWVVNTFAGLAEKRTQKLSGSREEPGVCNNGEGGMYNRRARIFYSGVLPPNYSLPTLVGSQDVERPSGQLASQIRGRRSRHDCGGRRRHTGRADRVCGLTLGPGGIFAARVRSDFCFLPALLLNQVTAFSLRERGSAGWLSAQAANDATPRPSGVEEALRHILDPFCGQESSESRPVPALGCEHPKGLAHVAPSQGIHVLAWALTSVSRDISEQLLRGVVREWHKAGAHHRSKGYQSTSTVSSGS